MRKANSKKSMKCKAKKQVRCKRQPRKAAAKDAAGDAGSWNYEHCGGGDWSYE